MGVMLYVSNTFITEEFAAEGQPIVDTVTQEFVAIQGYTETCLYSTAQNGLILLGQQGGYIYPTSLGDFSITNPTDSIGISIDPLLIPYWHYNSEYNGNPSVSLASLQPSLYDSDLDKDYAGGEYMSIEAQLGRYIEEEINDCLNDYEVFSGQGFNVSADFSGMQATARVWDSGYVDFILELDLSAVKGGAQQEMTTFYASHDLDLAHIYDIANQITEAEQNYTFLENQALELLSIYSRLDSDFLAPMSSMDVGDTSDSVTWSATEIKSKVIGLLSSYVPVLRYYGSENFMRYEYSDDELLTDLYQQISDNMVVPLGGAEDLGVSFSYFSWEPYLSMNGGQEEIEPSGMVVTSPFDVVPFKFGFLNYYNTYDLSYPVLVTIEDDGAFKGEGYTFNLALESNIINNIPAESTESLPIPTVSSNKASLACDEEQRNTELIQTIVVDAYTNEPIEMVDVVFELPGFDSCYMGETDNLGSLEDNYPSAYGGVLELSHDDYLTTEYLIDTNFFKESGGLYGYSIAGLDYQVLMMYQEQELEVSIDGLFLRKCITPKVCISKWNYRQDDCNEDADQICFSNGNVSMLGSAFFSDSVLTLTANGSITRSNEYYANSGSIEFLPEYYQATLILERVSPLVEDYGSAQYTQFVNLEGNETNTITLVPGIYKVDLNVMINDDVLIYEDDRCLYDDEEDDYTCNNMTGLTLDNYVGGSYSWDTEDTYWYVYPEDLYSSDELTFHALLYDINDAPQSTISYDDDNDEIEINVQTHEDLMVSGYISEIAAMENARATLEPEWSSSWIEE